MAKTVVSDTIHTTRYLTIEKVKPVFTVDTVEVYIDSRDSVWKENRAPVFSASLDTAMFDSSLSLEVKYHSPIPLDERSYFNITAKLKERMVIQTKKIYFEKEEDFTSKWLHIGLVIAPGYGVLNKQTDIFVGMGLMIGL